MHASGTLRGYGEDLNSIYNGIAKLDIESGDELIREHEELEYLVLGYVCQVKEWLGDCSDGTKSTRTSEARTQLPHLKFLNVMGTF